MIVTTSAWSKYTKVTTPAQPCFKLLLGEDQKPKAWLFVSHSDHRQVWIRSYRWGTRTFISGLEVIKLDFILRLKRKRNDWLLADTCPQAANHFALFWVWDCWLVGQQKTKALSMMIDDERFEYPNTVRSTDKKKDHNFSHEYMHFSFWQPERNLLC